MTPRPLIGAVILCALLPAQDPPKPPVPAARLRPAPVQQEKSQEQLAALREAKLAKPVFQLAPWLTDYDAARAAAAEEGKLIFAYFTRSYAA